MRSPGSVFKITAIEFPDVVFVSRPNKPPIAADPKWKRKAPAKYVAHAPPFDLPDKPGTGKHRMK